MLRCIAIAGCSLVALVGTARAQESGGFAILRGTDTVAAEQFSREEVQLSGTLVRQSGTARERVRYRATLVEDQSAPLIELSAWRGDDPDDSPARQTTRLIFKDDSVAVDEASRWAGVDTRILATVRDPIPYLNLSTAFLEQATRRAGRTGGSDPVAVPFFNLGGGQTVTGSVGRLGRDSATVRIGTVEFRLRVDGDGRILGGSVPAQGLVIVRTGTH